VAFLGLHHPQVSVQLSPPDGVFILVSSLSSLVFVAAWVVYFSAVSVTGGHPFSFAAASGARHLNVAEVDGPQGEVSLP